MPAYNGSAWRGAPKQQRGDLGGDGLEIYRRIQRRKRIADPVQLAFAFIVGEKAAHIFQ